MASNEKFIEEVYTYIKKHTPSYIRCYSAIIAQFCLESKYGTSNKVKVINNGKIEWRHNYAGLKYNPKQPKRCPSAIGYFAEGGSEQNANGSYTNSNMLWQKFDSLESCVKGYFEFISISNYSNLKNVEDPQKYLELIKQDKYATSLDYVNKCMNMVNQYNLTKYDPNKSNTAVTTQASKYYRVQVGAYKNKSNAIAMQNSIKKAGFSCIVKQYGVLFKCQIGAYKNKSNAESVMATVRSKGFSAFVTYC